MIMSSPSDDGAATAKLTDFFLAPPTASAADALLSLDVRSATLALRPLTSLTCHVTILQI